MAYLDGFISVRHTFLTDRRFTAAEKTVLIWLASKPDGWDVIQEQAEVELSMGRQQAGRLLRNLRAKGAITKPDPIRQPDGAFAAVPGRLAIRGEIRYITPGRTGLPEPRSPVVQTNEGITTNEGIAGLRPAGNPVTSSSARAPDELPGVPHSSSAASERSSRDERESSLSYKPVGNASPDFHSEPANRCQTCERIRRCFPGMPATEVTQHHKKRTSPRAA